MGAISVPLVTITYLWDDFPSYNVSCPEDCKNSTDRFAYTTWLDQGMPSCIQMGKINVAPATQPSAKQLLHSRMTMTPGTGTTRDTPPPKSKIP